MHAHAQAAGRNGSGRRPDPDTGSAVSPCARARLPPLAGLPYRARVSFGWDAEITGHSFAILAGKNRVSEHSQRVFFVRAGILSKQHLRRVVLVCTREKGLGANCPYFFRKICQNKLVLGVRRRKPEHWAAENLKKVRSSLDPKTALLAGK
eukprot:gene11491-biopygen9418